MTQTKLIVHTDGGARGNPGLSGIGIVVRDGDGKTLVEISKFIGHQTNNFAEYEAVIEALTAIRKRFGAEAKHIEVAMHLDSELVVRQLSKVYKVKEPALKEQHRKVMEMTTGTFRHVSFTHVPRGKNADADRLANDAMDRGQ